MLRLFGHCKVSVLNGGLKSWISIGGATDSGAETPVAVGQFTIRPAVGANVINLASLQALVTDGIAGQIADARPKGRFFRHRSRTSGWLARWPHSRFV